MKEELKTAHPKINIDKKLVRQRFKRSLATYRSHAFVQQNMTLSLIDALLKRPDIRYSNVFEIGMGTGFLTEQLLEKCPIESICANDIVEDCELTLGDICSNYGKTKNAFLGGDIETIALPTNISLIVSSSTFQWLSDIEVFFDKLSGAMTAGAHLAFTTFGDTNLSEINDILKLKLNYTPYAELLEIVSQNFDVLYSKSEQQTIYFDNATDILHHLKYTGVNALSQQRWTRNDINSFVSEYTKRFTTDKGLSLTYNPLYFIAKKKN